MLQPACEVIAVRAIHLLYWQKSPEHYLFQRNPWLVLSFPAVLTTPCWRVAHTCEFSFSYCKSHEVSSRSRKKGHCPGSSSPLPLDWWSQALALTECLWNTNSFHLWASLPIWGKVDDKSSMPLLTGGEDWGKNHSKCGLDKHLKSTEAKLESETV